MIALYVFSLVLGGGVLGLSVLGDLFGGHGHVDLGGPGGGLDADVHAELGDHGGGAHTADASGDTGHAGTSHMASKIFSIRSASYSLFGFGGVGTALTLLGTGIGPTTTAALSVGTALVAGVLVNGMFAWLKRGESGALAGEERYAGHLGRVTLPIEGSGGKIVVEIAGREVELAALPHASAAGDASRWHRVLVVEMDSGVALVAPAEDDNYLMS